VSLKQQRRWRAALVDVGLIFFSVLLAFWIEARWHDSQEAARQRSYLQGVAEDLTRVRGQLEEALAQRQAFDLATDSLLTATSRPDSTLRISSRAATPNRTTGGGTWIPICGRESTMRRGRPGAPAQRRVGPASWGISSCATC
jgi:hypothetical protein